MTSRFGYIMFVVKDMESSISFYKKLLSIDPDFSTERWSQFTKDQLMVGLHSANSWSDPEDPLAKIGPGPKGITFGIWVNNLEREIERLGKEGIKAVYGPRMTGIGNLVYVTDPDGHYIQVCEPTKK